MAYCKVHFIALSGGRALCDALHITPCGQTQTPRPTSIICTACKEALAEAPMSREMRTALNEVLVNQEIITKAQVLDYSWTRVSNRVLIQLQQIFIFTISTLFQDLMAHRPVQRPAVPLHIPRGPVAVPMEVFNDMTAESIMEIVTDGTGMSAIECIELYNRLGAFIDTVYPEM